MASYTSGNWNKFAHLKISVDRAQDLNVDIRIHGKWFVDQHNRSLLLRGINLSGNSKLPTTPAELRNNPAAKLSFVGRPFRADEAHEHFRRLRIWGLTFVRLLVPWEALEHEGPGKYDDEFIEHLLQILDIANQYKIKCFIDPHQDTWSRFSGGSGAPSWTFEVAGLNIENLADTAAVVTTPEGSEQNLFIWPTNYSKLACATMFTLFFGGDIFAPNSNYLGGSIQGYLQDHFIRCYQYLARKIHNHPAVIGFEVMNEPSYGYIGLKSAHYFDSIVFLHLGYMPNAFQGFALGSGCPMKIDFYAKSWPWPSRKQGSAILNPQGKSAWLPNRECVWKQNGVWGIVNGNPVPLVPDYFTRNPKTNETVDFNRDCYSPFIQKYIKAIHEVDPDLYVLFEPIPNEDPPAMSHQDWKDNLIYAPHWYDLNVLFNRSYNGFFTHDVHSLARGKKNIINATYLGITGAIRNYKDQIKTIIRQGHLKLGDRPCVVGEFGIPMDFNEKSAFETGDYTLHVQSMNAIISAVEENLASFTLWNYNPINDHLNGDHWNGENFSIYSPGNSPTRKGGRVPESFLEGGRGHEHHSGGRVLDSIIRPYASKIAGIPVHAKFDLWNLTYDFEFITDSNPNAIITQDNYKQFTTEIFIPNYHYGDIECPIIKVSDGEWSYDKSKQTIYWIYDPTYEEKGIEKAFDRYVTHVIDKGQVKHWIRIQHPAPPGAQATWLQILIEYIRHFLEYNFG